MPTHTLLCRYGPPAQQHDDILFPANRLLCMACFAAFRVANKQVVSFWAFILAANAGKQAGFPLFLLGVPSSLSPLSTPTRVNSRKIARLGSASFVKLVQQALAGLPEARWISVQLFSSAAVAEIN